MAEGQPMNRSGTEPHAQSYYHRVARELEEIAETVRNKPELNHRFAERLISLAREIREDAKILATRKPMDG